MERYSVPRSTGAYTMHQCWSRFEHWGNVPNMDERLHWFAYFNVFGGPAAAGTGLEKSGVTPVDAGGPMAVGIARSLNPVKR